MTVKILDSSLAFKGEIDNFESFFVSLVHGGMSSAQLTIGTNKNNVDLLTKGAYIYAGDDKKHLFIITENPKQYGKGGSITKVVAYDVFWILGGRLSNTGTTALSYSSKSVEYIIKDLIDKAVINPSDANRDISTISIAVNNDKGSTINATVNQTYLDEDIKQLLAIDGLGLCGEYDSETPEISIDVYEGDDRSVGNGDGNSPVIFDVKFDNILSGEEKDSMTFVRNYAYIGGVSDAGARVIEEYGTETGINRREMFVDGGDTDDETELEATGKASVIDVEKGISVNANAMVGAFIYDEDY